MIGFQEREGQAYDISSATRLQIKTRVLSQRYRWHGVVPGQATTRGLT